MSEEAGVALRAEMNTIMTDKNHPLHTGYHKGDPGVMAQIDAKYKAVYGDAPVVLGEGVNATTATDSGGQSEGDPIEVLTGKDAEEGAALMTSLRAEWGESFAANHEFARAGLRDIERRLGREGVDLMYDQHMKAGGTQLEAARYLANLGMNLKKG